MAKRLINKTWDEVQKEMSIAGEPDKARKFGEEVYALATNSVDVNNPPSVGNEIFALEKVIADLKKWEKIVERRQSVKLPKKVK